MNSERSLPPPVVGCQEEERVHVVHTLSHRRLLLWLPHPGLVWSP